MDEIDNTSPERVAEVDILADAQQWLAEVGSGQRLQTHSATCHRWHSICLIGRLARELEGVQWRIKIRENVVSRLQAENERLTLTDEEREAIEWYANFPDGIHADTLRNLLERLT